MSFDVTKIDWYKVMERKGKFFAYIGFIEAETKNLEPVAGFYQKCYLHTYHEDLGANYRSKSEFHEIDSHFLKLIKADDPRLPGWAQLGWQANKKADEVIEKFSRSDVVVDKQDFCRHYTIYTDALFYGASIPWMILGGLELAINQGESREAYQKYFDMFESLRSVTKYPQLETTMLKYYLNIIKQEHNIDEILLPFITPEELRITLCDGQVAIDEEVLKKRRDWCVYWYDPLTRKIVFNYDREFAEKIPILNMSNNLSDVDAVKGTVAYKGVVRGEVQIVTQTVDMKKFKEGNILVSDATNPSLMPVIKKCSAIVTDEGGLMCHAAIVSRELKKPCVIGTKIATKVLKDGDEVEVDANEGVVKILKKAQ